MEPLDDHDTRLNERVRMVDKQLFQRGIHDERVLGGDAACTAGVFRVCRADGLRVCRRGAAD